MLHICGIRGGTDVAAMTFCSSLARSLSSEGKDNQYSQTEQAVSEHFLCLRRVSRSRFGLAFLLVNRPRDQGHTRLYTTQLLHLIRAE